MTDERRYQEDEVKQIFDLAVSGDEVRLPAARDGSGLTLSELQNVGGEVGLAPARIAEAAFAIDARREVLPRRKILGLPVSAGRLIDLPRALTDREWEILVGEFRETFGARGQLSMHGGIREWSNGNLHVFLEPTETGHRLRLRTHKGTAMPQVVIGAAGLTIGWALIALFSAENLNRAALVLPVLLAITGAVTLISNAFRLPRWARKREDQMEYIAGRVAALLEDGSISDELDRTET
jgi:hypothetical protein